MGARRSATPGPQILCRGRRRARLGIDGEEPLQRLHQDDCLLLGRGLPFWIGARAGLSPMQLAALPAYPPGGVATINGGGACLLVGGHFRFDERHHNILRDALPAVVIVRRQEERAVLRWALEQIRRELSSCQPGGALVIDHLCHLMLLHALRLHLADGSLKTRSWLAALSDRQIAQALRAIHSDPARRWSVETLASQARMSRMVFAERFKRLVGCSPMGYLMHWRMQLAADRIRRGHDSLAAVARSVGYESQSAFSTAFRRAMGMSPREHAKDPEIGLVPR